jgi:hypothetical protein
MAESPDLEVPFTNDSERAGYIAELLSLSARLQLWRDQATHMAPPTEEARTARRGVRPEPRHRHDLAPNEWANLFETELDALFAARDRVVHGMRLGDRELRGAVWLAEQLVELLESSTTTKA